MNSISLVGRTGKEPEIKFFENGNVVCNCTIAVRKRVKGAEATDWFNLEAWGKTAELFNDYVRKGDNVAIVGSMTSDTYEKDGQQRTKWYVKIRELTLVQSKNRDEKPAEKFNVTPPTMSPHPAIASPAPAPDREVPF